LCAHPPGNESASSARLSSRAAGLSSSASVRACDRLAILDDEDPLPELRDWWLPVNQEHGLTMELASAAAQLLSTGPVYTAAD
jgi:hypothetical protein